MSARCVVEYTCDRCGAIIIVDAEPIPNSNTFIIGDFPRGWVTGLVEEDDICPKCVKDYKRFMLTELGQPQQPAATQKQGA